MVQEKQYEVIVKKDDELKPPNSIYIAIQQYGDSGFKCQLQDDTMDSEDKTLGILGRGLITFLMYNTGYVYALGQEHMVEKEKLPVEDSMILIKKLVRGVDIRTAEPLGMA